MRQMTLGVLVAAFLLPACASAQQPQPSPQPQVQQAQQQPGIMVVSQNKCNFGTMNELNNFWRTNAAPILNELVQQGRLTGWGLLEHAWGDEWNSVVYYTARDLATFEAAFGEFFGRLLQREPNAMQALARFCSEHRDNIYSIVVMQSAPAR